MSRLVVSFEIEDEGVPAHEILNDINYLFKTYVDNDIYQLQIKDLNGAGKAVLIDE